MTYAKVKPSELELQVLAVLWEFGPLAVRQVHERMRDGRTRAYTTVLAVLQGMEKKGLVGHTRDGMANIYEPVVTQKQIVNPFLKELLRNVFGGDPTAVVRCLLECCNPSEDDLSNIRGVIDGVSGEAKRPVSRRHEAGSL